MKLMKLLNEINIDNLNRIYNLPKGKLFDDAKNIETVFKKSKRTWSEVIENAEKHKDNSIRTRVDIKSINITQPNVQIHKIKNIIGNINHTPIINVVEFPDGERVIYDGHHRLMANWAIGNLQIDVNLIRVNRYD